MFIIKIVKATCWESIVTITGSRSFLQIHQMLGRSKFLSFISNILRPNLNIHLEGNFSKFIHGSTMITKSGFEDKINLLRSNLYGALDKPLMFKKGISFGLFGKTNL